MNENQIDLVLYHNLFKNLHADNYKGTYAADELMYSVNKELWLEKRDFLGGNPIKK